MPKINVTASQLRTLLRAEGCDCPDKRLAQRGQGCTTQWIRCQGRADWKRRNDPKYQRGLAQLGHSHPSHDRRRKKAPHCPECERWLAWLRKQLTPDTQG